MIRGIVTSVVEGVIKRFSATGRPDETIADRELFQHYGFTSRPKPGAELIIIREGNQIIAIASDDRRYRISLESGEVALYTDEGDKVHLKRDRIIEIVGGAKVIATTAEAEVTATTSATVTSPVVTVIASTSVTLDTPLTTCTGDLDVTGNVTIGGTADVTGDATVGGTAEIAGALSSATSVADPTGTMAAMRDIYNAHTHPENGTGGGTTSAPNEAM